MPNKIGIVLALDGEKEFTQAMKNAQQSAKLCDQTLKNLKNEYSGSANSLEALTKKQDALKKSQDAYTRVLNQAKNGQSHARDNYKKTAEALEELKSKLSTAENALKDMERAGDTSSDAYKTQARAVDELQRAMEKQSQEYAKAEGNLTAWDTKVSKAESDVKQNSKALNDNARYLDEAKNSADHCATSIDRYGKEVKEAGEESKAAGSQVKSLGETLKQGAILKAGALATQAVQELGEKAVEAAKYVVEVGSNFEQAMDKVSALSGATGSELDSLSEKARELGASTQYSATEVADAFSYMALAGWDTQSMLDGIDGVLNLAAASQMDLAQASDIVTDNLSAFGLAAGDASKLADEMAFAQANSNTTTVQLADAFGNCAANMHAAGQDIETTTSFLEAFANQGIKGSEAGTKLSAIMRDITAKMKDGAIQIGDTSVAVTDAHGNFRDLTDILTDVEAATAGMGDAERAAALSATFTSRSIGGLNMILTEGMDNIAGYEDALRNADDTASNMAGTMQGNLKGAITELNSAAEGLGIELYNHVQGPLTGAVEVATGLINGITDALNPQKTELEQFIDDIKSSNQEVQGLLDSADAEVKQAESKVGELEAYKDIILDLQNIINNGGELDSFQLYQMQNAVNAVKGEIPEIGELFDETTGKIELSTAAIENLFKATEEGAMQQAFMKSMEKDIQAQTDALVNEARATAAVKKIQQELSEWEEEHAEQIANREAMGDIYRDEEYERLTDSLEDATKAQKEAHEVAEQAKESYELTAEAAKEYGLSLDDVTKSTDDEADAAQKAQEADLAHIQGHQGKSKAAQEAAQSEEELALTEEEAAEQAKQAAQAQYQAAQQIQQAHQQAADAIRNIYDSAKEAAQKAFDFNPFEAWTQNEENGIAKFQESLNSQIEGLTNYSNNLQTVSDHVGHEITPEFLGYLQDMGTDGAQLMQELANALSEGDTSKVEALMDAYEQAIDKRDEIATIMAANTTAMKVGAKEMGSTEIEWENLDKAVEYLEQLGGEADEGVRAAFEQAVEAAKETGVKIPDGLIEGIENGSEDPTAALAQATASLNAAIEGQGEALKEVAKDVGAKIPEGYDEAIQEGGDAAVQAMQEMLSNISDATGEAEEAGRTAGETVGDETATAIEGKGGDVQDAGESIAEQGAEGAESKSGEFQSAGSTDGESFVEGVNSQQGAAQSAGSSLAQAAQAGASGGSLYGVGVQLAAGMASGILSQASSIASAAASLVSQAISAAKNAAAIKSPSRKMRDQVGKMLGKGAAVGIKLSTKDTIDAAEEQMNQTLASLAGWLKRNKKKIGSTGEQWSADIAYAWRSLANREISSGFGVSKSKTTGSGKNQKTEKKSTEEYYSDIMKMAKKYLDNVSALYTVSEQDELEYWQSVKKSLKTGTQAWYDASDKIKSLREKLSKEAKEAKKDAKQAAIEAREAIVENAEKRVEALRKAGKIGVQTEIKYWQEIKKQLAKGTKQYKEVADKIKELKKEIGTIGAANNLLSNYQTYYDISLKAEMQYWNEIRKHYKAGTAERIEADRNFFEAKEALNEKLKELEDDYADKIQDANKKYEDAFEARKESIKSAYDLFDYFESSSATGQELLFNIQTQAAGYKEWSKSIDELQRRGIFSDALMDELTEKGPQSIAAIKALLMLSNEELRAYQKAYDEKEEAAAEQARKDTADVKEEVKKEIKALKEQRKKDLSEINKAIPADLKVLSENIKKFSEDQTDALVAAFDSTGAKTAAGIGANVAKALLDAMGLTGNDGFEIAKRVNEAVKGGAKGSLDNIVAEVTDNYGLEKKAKEQERKLEAAQNQVTTAYNAREKAFNTLSKAQDALNKKKIALDNAKANRADVYANKKSTAKQKSSADNALKKAQDAYNKAADSLKTAKAAYKTANTTLAQKQATLNALNKAGYMTGTKRVGSDGLIWMDEELGNGAPEMIVRKSDNAILTRAQASDAIIPANLVNNLFKWGAIDPATMNVASMAALNMRLAEGYQQMARSSSMERDKLDEMLALMNQFMPYLSERMTVPIQSRKAVSVMSDDISRDMAARARRRR